MFRIKINITIFSKHASLQARHTIKYIKYIYMDEKKSTYINYRIVIDLLLTNNKRCVKEQMYILRTNNLEPSLLSTQIYVPIFFEPRRVNLKCDVGYVDLEIYVQVNILSLIVESSPKWSSKLYYHISFFFFFFLYNRKFNFAPK